MKYNFDDWNGDEKLVSHMNRVNTRFNQICSIYLPILTMDDVKYLEPTDLINMVPPKMYEHKLLMTIMVRRYLYRIDDDIK